MSEAQARFLGSLASTVLGDRDFIQKLHVKYGGQMSSSQASEEIKHLQSLRDGARPMVRSGRGGATTTAPAGRYAVEEGGITQLVEISKPSEGRWIGYTFVKTVPIVPNGHSEPLRGAAAARVLNEIERDPIVAASNYGRITHLCGQCGRPLRDERSVSLGIGPDCRSKFD